MSFWSWRKSWHLAWIAVGVVGLCLSASTFADTIAARVVGEQLTQLRGEISTAQTRLTEIEREIATATSQANSTSAGIASCGTPCQTACSSGIADSVSSRSGEANYCVVIFDNFSTDINVLPATCLTAIRGCSVVVAKERLARLQVEQRETRARIDQYQQTSTSLAHDMLVYSNCPNCPREPSGGEIAIGILNVVGQAAVGITGAYFANESVHAMTGAAMHFADVEQARTADYMRYCTTYGVQCEQSRPLMMPNFFGGMQIAGVPGPYGQYGQYYSNVVGPANPMNALRNLSPSVQLSLDPFNTGSPYPNGNGSYFNPYLYTNPAAAALNPLARGPLAISVTSPFADPNAAALINGGRPAYGPNGLVYGPNGQIYGPNGQVYGPNGVTYGPNGSVYGPNGVAYGPNGQVYGPNGSLVYGPNGSIYAQRPPYDDLYARGGRAYYNPYDYVYARNPQEDYLYQRSMRDASLEADRRREAALDMDAIDRQQWELSLRRRQLDSTMRQTYYNDNSYSDYYDRWRISGGNGGAPGPGLSGRVFIGG